MRPQRRRQRTTTRRRRSNDATSTNKSRFLIVTIVVVGGVAIGNYVALVWIVPKRPLANRQEQQQEASPFLATKKDSLSNGTSNTIPFVSEQSSQILNDARIAFQQEIASKAKIVNAVVPGVFVVSMHRSGSSLLAGLLHRGLGYKAPGLQLRADSANPRGYFENIHVVTQNNIWLQQQGVSWDSVLLHSSFDPWKSCIRKQDCPEAKDSLVSLKSALLHYNLPRNVPWIMKDPRLCITLINWLRVLHFDRPPAVLFTYRHPLEVTTSLLQHASHCISKATGLRLWITYNRLAMENTRNLCRVVTSNNDILQDPASEMARIGAELSNTCGLPGLPVDRDAIQMFVDSTLIHHNATEYHSTGLPTSDFENTNQQDEQELYQTALQIYRDLETGTAFRDDYQWPSL